METFVIFSVLISSVICGEMPLPASCIPPKLGKGPFAVSKAASTKATMMCLKSVAEENGINIPAAEACLAECAPLEDGETMLMAKMGVTPEMQTCVMKTCKPMMAECATSIGVKLANMTDMPMGEEDIEPGRSIVRMFATAQTCGSGAKTCLSAAFGDILKDPRRLVKAVMRAEEKCLANSSSMEENDLCEEDMYTLMAAMVVDSCGMENKWTMAAVECGIPEETVTAMKNMHMQMMLEMM